MNPTPTHTHSTSQKLFVIGLSIFFLMVGFYLGMKYQKIQEINQSSNRYYFDKGEACFRAFFQCPQGFEHFNDAVGCGCQVSTPAVPTPPSTPDTSGWQTYTNTQFGFSFTLPASWIGYTIIQDKWESNTATQAPLIGPVISIRHPQWTTQTPRQDIPIMVFTIKLWAQLQQEEFHIDAAPVLPSELGRNAHYVFALPGRYNYTLLPGYEEVEQILQTRPLKVQDTKPQSVSLCENIFYSNLPNAGMTFLQSYCIGNYCSANPSQDTCEAIDVVGLKPDGSLKESYESDGIGDCVWHSEIATPNQCQRKY